jgi:hypothetical protein
VKMIVAAAQNPAVFWRLSGPFRYRLLQRRQALETARMQVHLALLQAVEQHMLVAVVETRHRGAAGKLDHPRVRSDKTVEFCSRTARQNPSVTDGQGLGEALGQAEKIGPPVKTVSALAVLTRALLLCPQ